MAQFAFIFGVKQSKKALLRQLDSEDAGNMSSKRRQLFIRTRSNMPDRQNTKVRYFLQTLPDLRNFIKKRVKELENDVFYKRAELFLAEAKAR